MSKSFFISSFGSQQVRRKSVAPYYQLGKASNVPSYQILCFHMLQGLQRITFITSENYFLIQRVLIVGKGKELGKFGKIWQCSKLRVHALSTEGFYLKQAFQQSRNTPKPCTCAPTCTSAAACLKCFTQLSSNLL